MIIDYDLTINDLTSQVKDGKKLFSKIDFGEGDICDCDMEGVIFEECFLAINFSNVNLRYAKFLNSCMKTCIFNNVDLTNAEIKSCSVESVVFRNSDLNGLAFDNNSSYSFILNQWDLESFVEKDK